MSDRQVDFDPYHKWLGIPESEQPPNHYRLLGIELFEDDADVIQAAADRQMSHVKAFVTGPYGSHSQELLNELSKARVCLLNAKLKPTYDQKLIKEHSKRMKEAEVANKISRPVESHSSIDTLEPAVEQSGQHPSITVRNQPGKRKGRKKKSSSGMLNKVLLLGGMIAAAAIGYVVVTNNGPNPTIADNPPAGSDQGETPSAGSQPPNPVDRKRDRNRDRTPKPPGERRKPREWDGDQTLASLLESNEDAANDLFGGLGDDDQTQDSGESSTDDSTTELNPPAADSPFASLPKVISLANFVNKGKPVGEFAAPINALEQLNVSVLVPRYLERGNNRVTVEKVERSETELWWKVFEESRFGVDSLLGDDDFGIGNDPKPIAIVRATSEGIGLVCYGGGANTRKLSRLQNCLLSFTSGKHSHAIQMRTPVEDATSIVVDDWSEPQQVFVNLDAITDCPPVDEMAMHVVVQESFPKVLPDESLGNQLSIGQRLSLKFAAIENAAVAVYWEEQGQQLAVNFATGFRLKIFDEVQERFLGEAQLADALAKVQEDRNLARGNLSNAKQNKQWRTKLNRRIADADTNEATIIPALKKLGEETKGVNVLGFELYLPIGSERVVFYRRAMKDAN